MNYVDGETSAEKRTNAANILCVSRNANRQEVTRAYRKRVMQRMELEEDDDTFHHAVCLLHDAHTIMSYSVAQQWRADAKLAFTGSLERYVDMILEYTNALMDGGNDWKLDEASIKIVTKLNRNARNLKKQVRLVTRILVLMCVDNCGALILWATDMLSHEMAVANLLLMMVLGGCVAILNKSANRKFYNIVSGRSR